MSYGVRDNNHKLMNANEGIGRLCTQFLSFPKLHWSDLIFVGGVLRNICCQSDLASSRFPYNLMYCFQVNLLISPSIIRT